MSLERWTLLLDSTTTLFSGKGHVVADLKEAPSVACIQTLGLVFSPKLTKTFTAR